MTQKPTTQVRIQLREAIEKGLDEAVTQAEAALVSLWELEDKNELSAAEIPTLATAFLQHLKKLAPPPPKKQKLNVPLRKILPMAESGVRPALDVAMLLRGLVQIGDFTKQTDKERTQFLDFLDDWRRMIFESAKIQSFTRFRELAGTEERSIGRRFSRVAACDLLEALYKRRNDKFTMVPDVSMIACDRCHDFRSQDRIRCQQCRGLFCTRCFSRASDLCLKDYSVRYATLDPDVRWRVGMGAKEMCRHYRLSEHMRNEVFVQALGDEGVDVVFQDALSGESQESDEKQGRRRLILRTGETSINKRLLFAALARAFLRSATQPIPPPEDDPQAEPTPPPFDPDSVRDPLFVDYFADICLGLPLEETSTASGSD